MANQSFDGDGGSAQVTVVRNGDTSGSDQVDYATSDGTATAGAEYQAVSGTLTFSPGQTFLTFSVPLLPSSLSGVDETFDVTLNNPVSLGNPSEAETIGPNNPVPVTLVYSAAGPVQFVSPSYLVAQNNAELTVTLRFDRASQGDSLTVDYATHDGTATAGADYTAVSGTLSFPAYGPQESYVTITIPILNDLLLQNNATFYLTLSDPLGGLTLGDVATTTVTILNDNVPQAAETTTNLTSDSPNGSTYGQTVTFTATVSAGSGTPSGSVDFVDSTTGQDLGSSPLEVVNGVDEATMSVSSLDVGSDTIVASYTSDSDNFAPSQDSLAQAVAPATLTVTADGQRRFYGSANPPLTDTITGFVNGDTSSVVSGAAESEHRLPRSASGVGS